MFAAFSQTTKSPSSRPSSRLWPAATFLFAFVLAPAAFAAGEAPALGSTVMLPTGPARLTFIEEFNGAALDRKVWNTHFAPHMTRIGNELQLYTPDNFEVGNGLLRIRTDNRKISGFNYTSGGMTTYGTFDQAYGYFEIRAKLPAGKGLWPAFWLVPQDLSWPPEIDVLEFLGRDVGAVYATYHWGTFQNHKQDDQGFRIGDWTSDYHTFAVDWRPGSIAWYYDGKEVKRIKGDHVSDKPMYMLVNTAMGGWGGDPDDKTPFPSYFDIDYIRAYQYEGMPQPPAPDRKILKTMMSSHTAKPGDTVTIDFKIELAPNQPPMTLIAELHNATNRTEVSRAMYGIEDTAAGGVIKRQWVYTVPPDMKPGLYAIALGTFRKNWEGLDWVENTGTLLVQ